MTRVTAAHEKPVPATPKGFAALTTTEHEQDKLAERAFFSGHAASDGYNVFSGPYTLKLFRRCVELAQLKPGAAVADVGCGSGVFSRLLREHGFKTVGLDLSYSLLAVGRRKCSGLDLVAGDAERLPFPSESLDGVMLSGIVHHLPEPGRCAGEVFRVLKPGGVFVAFDPNRLNPFMYLYRDRSSPFYSSRGVTPNERPVVPKRVRSVFSNAGFRVAPSEYMSMRYRYIADSRMKFFLLLYNGIESILFGPEALKRYRVFVLSYGFKP